MLADVRYRAGVVLVEDGRVALIRRQRAGMTYFVVPGGGVESGESPDTTAVREAFEELGVTVALERVVAELSFSTPTAESWQVYFWARRIAGQFGAGTGPELMGLYPAERGTYHAEWVPLDRLGDLDVRPRALARQLQSTPSWPRDLVLRVHETG